MHHNPYDDEVDFPDWMLPDNHPNKMRMAKKPSGKSLNESIADIMNKPVIQYTPEDLMKSILKDE